MSALRSFLRRFHKHSRGAWAGDQWDFTQDRHVTRWRCDCGAVIEEVRDWNEFPHIVAHR